MASNLSIEGACAMATKMQIASLEFVEKSEDSQKVAVLNSPFDISVRYARIPEPGDGEIRIKVKYVGICGSDLEAYRGTRAAEFISTPARLGHEVAGVIDKIGSNVIGLRVGDKVTCRYVWGAYAQYIVCRPFNVKVLPADFPLRDASLIEILPGVIHAAELSNIDQSRNVLIMGQGVSGLVLTQVFRLYSPKRLVVTDLHERNLALARKYGATDTYKVPHPGVATMDVLRGDFPHGFDVVVPCLLEGDGMIDAIDACVTGGRIVMYGCIGVCRKPVDFYKVHTKRLSIFSTEPRRDIDMRRFFEEGVRMVIDGLVNTSEIIDHIIPIDEIDRAFAIRDSKDSGAIHILIDCSPESNLL